MLRGGGELLAPASARRQTIHFQQLHACGQSRVKQVLYCESEDRPLCRDELMQGYEYEKGRL